MRNVKVYITFAVVVLIAFFIKINTWDSSFSEVSSFRGATLQNEIFYPLISKNLNDSKSVHVTINDEKYVPTFQDVYVGDDLNPYVSTDFMRDVFYASARLYDESTLRIVYNEREYKYNTGNDQCFVANERCYLALDEACKIVGADYEWDEALSTVHIKTPSKAPVLPTEFDLRRISCTTPTQNQGNSATCWAYASIGALESTLRPSVFEFSVSDMIENNSFGLDSSKGGDFTMALAYLLSWQGPKANVPASNILEEKKVAKHVMCADFFTQDDIDEIKWAIYRYGAVSSSLYANVSTDNLNKSSYYNKRTNSYCYMGNNEPNHEIEIVGWDDNYSSENFSESVPANGAFICQNSWGSSFGDDGFFYVSYYDTNVGAQAVSFTRVDNANYLDCIHQTDLCGYVGSVGFGNHTVYGANVYTADSDEQLKAVGFYTLSKNNEYKIYIARSDGKNVNLNERALFAEGKITNRGYHTVEFEKDVHLSKGEKFAVILELTSPTKTKPLAVEYKANDRTKNVILDDGEGYISDNGANWDDSVDKISGNVCLKAYGSAIKV